MKNAGWLRSAAAVFCAMAFSFVWPAAQSCFAGDNAFSDIENSEVPVEERSDQTCCDRGIYSKSFDRWLRDYANGHDVEAEKDWVGVLRAARGAVSLRKLVAAAQARLEFVEGPDGEKLDKRGGSIAAVKAILATTEHLLGPCHQTGSIADYLAARYKSGGDLTTSIIYCKKSVSVFEHVYGTNDARLCSQLLLLAETEVSAKDYANARAHAQRALTLATKEHRVKWQNPARTILTRLAKIHSTDKKD